MKNKILNYISKICFTIAVVLTILFVILIIMSHLKHQELLSNPLAMVAPFYIVAKHLAIRILIPALFFTVICFICKIAYNKST